MRPEIESTDQNRSFIEEARRTQIIQCAIETISTIGYANASLAQIAKRAGISKGVISYHFADKDELIHEVLRKVLDEFKDYMRSRILAEENFAARLRAYIESNIGFMAARRDYVIVLFEIFSHGRSWDAEGSSSDKAEYESGLKELEQLLRKGQRAGEFREFAPRVMAITIRQGIDGVCPQLIADPKLDLDSYATELANIFDIATRKGVRNS